MVANFLETVEERVKVIEFCLHLLSIVLSPIFAPQTVLLI